MNNFASVTSKIDAHRVPEAKQKGRSSVFHQNISPFLGLSFLSAFERSGLTTRHAGASLDSPKQPTQQEFKYFVEASFSSPIPPLGGFNRKEREKQYNGRVTSGLRGLSARAAFLWLVGVGVGVQSEN